MIVVMVSGKLFFLFKSFLEFTFYLFFGFLEQILINLRAWFDNEEVLPWREIDSIAGVLIDRLPPVRFDT